VPLPAATSPDGGSARAQNRLNMQTFPEAPFRLNNWTAHGYQCVLDKTPDRILDIQARPLLAHYTLPYPAPVMHRPPLGMRCHCIRVRREHI